jgi:hypothetical protein
MRKTTKRNRKNTKDPGAKAAAHGQQDFSMRSRNIEKQYTLRRLARPDDPYGEADAKEEGIKEQVIYENNLTYSADLIELRQNIIRALWQYLRWVSLIPGQKPQALSSLVENLIDACLDWAEGKQDEKDT